jgi:pimeloyl-[acyl-carrier protein] synthase
MDTTHLFNPLATSGIPDPYPLFRRLREEDPVHRSRYGSWVISRHADIAAALRDPRFSSRPSRYSTLSARRLKNSVAADTARHMVMFLDAPEHTRLRKLLARVISDNLAVDLRGRIDALVDELLEPHLQHGRIDLIGDFAAPLPMHVVADMLGIPPHDRSQVKSWASDFFRIFAPIASDAQLHSIDLAADAFRHYLAELIRERRVRPGNDVISNLIAVGEADDRLTEEEIVVSCMVLFTNGGEAFTHLLGNGVLALLRDPAAMQQLRDDPSLAKSGVEELLRYDSPAALIGRTTTEAVSLHEKTIPTGAPVYLLLAAGNRDPERIEAPDSLDLGRRDNPHFGFGGGAHACLGAGIARMEAQVAINRLLERTRRVTLDTEQPVWLPGLFLRGLEALPLRLST